MEPESLLSKALDAMRTIGINEKRVKPVLDKLMKLYNNEWKLIEEDNFRILANVIFEEEDDDVNNVRKDMEEEDERKRPLKRRGTELRSQESCSNGGNFNLEFSSSENRNNFVVPKMPSLKDPSTSQTIKQEIESNRNSSLSKSSANPSSFPPCILASSTSSSGQVKVLLSCKLKDGKEKFVNQEELFKVLEEGKLKSYKLLDPTFSVKKILGDVCEYLLELATEASTSSKKLPSKHSISMNPCQQSLQRRSTNIAGNEDDKNPQRRNSKKVHPRRFCVDGMTKGLETCEISWASEAANCPFFNYIVHNFAFENAAIRFALSHIGSDEFCHGCGENCVSESSSCGCAGKNDREFAYTNKGLLKGSFLNDFLSSRNSFYYCSDCPLRRINGEMGRCKGHVKGEKFIKECCVKCGCHNTQCGNRVVQRGIQCKLQVFSYSEKKLWGLRTLEKLQKGTFVCEYVGEILTVDEWFEEKDRWSSMGTLEQVPNSPILLDAFWFLKDLVNKNEALCLDATYHGNIARFINYRSFGANLIGVPVKIESSFNHYYHVGLFARREIEALEELTWDYGSGFRTCTPLD